jgi:hypothetical protein
VKPKTLGEDTKLTRSFREPGFLKLFDAHRRAPECTAPQETETRSDVPRIGVARKIGTQPIPDSPDVSCVPVGRDRAPLSIVLSLAAGGEGLTRIAVSR